jgi:Holliday junction resolvase-like predicted endonuclease
MNTNLGNPTNKRKQGQSNEIISCEFLKNKGLQIIETNCYLGRFGEIDIVAIIPAAKEHDREIIFVEVRSMSACVIHPSQILSVAKQRRLKLLSRIWLKKHKLPEYTTSWRIDLIVVINKTKIIWYKAIC